MLLLSMAQNSEGRLAMVNPASIAEVENAIRALTDADSGRLKNFAKKRLQAIGRAAAGNDQEDILHEAIMRTLDDRRHWNKHAVSFVEHLMGVIRSVCSGLAEKMETQKHEEPLLESELEEDSEDPAVNPYHIAASTKLGPARIAEAKDTLVVVKETFRDDPVVLEIISGLEEGLNGPEIKEILGISQNDLEAAMRKLRRSKSKILA
jgi:DNA-directed RNA polymerase specialized sigma24 family protein